MIESLILTFDLDDDKNLFPYVKSLSSFPHKFYFTKGLNLIVGKNGSGKSTILKYISHILHCWQGGYTDLTVRSIRDLFVNFETTIKSNFVLHHDGQTTFYYSPDQFIGLLDGDFDDNYFKEAIFSLSVKQKSNGESNLIWLNRFIDKIKTYIAKNPTLELLSSDSQRVNDFWDPRINIIKQYLTPTIAKGQITILLDEPERGLDLDHQIQLNDILHQLLAQGFQIIMSTHSVVLYHLLKSHISHIIELTPHYTEQLNNILSKLY